MTVPQCTGECCRAFPLSKLTMLDLHRMSEKVDELSLEKINRPDDDAPKILSMVIPLGKFHMHGSPLFTCMHWNQETKLCKNYMNRPKMCSEYPYGRKCEHCQ